MSTPKPKSTDDLGFGTGGTDRSMNKDGSFNVQRVGDAAFRPYEIYHQLITISWPKFFTILFTAYFIANLIFAFIYYFIGTEHLTGVDSKQDELHKFLEAFFFSSQTLTTVGFGRIAPVGVPASTVAAIEAMLGVLVFAIATGLLYGRFSRPQARLAYSTHAVIAPYREGRGLMFRMANRRRNQLIEVEADITMAYFEKGAKIRSFRPLNLERKKINLFPLSWTLVHPVDESSPLWNVSEDELHEMKVELIVLVKAFDDTFSQTVYSRSSYRSHEILPGRKFLPMFFVEESGHTRLDLRLIDAMEQVELPQIKMAQLNETAQ